MTMICDSSVTNQRPKTSLQLLHGTVMKQSRVEIEHYSMRTCATVLVTHNRIMFWHRTVTAIRSNNKDLSLIPRTLK